MRTYPSAKCLNRSAISCFLTLVGKGVGVAPTVSAPGGPSNLFSSITRTAPGSITLTLREKHRDAQIVGYSFGKSDFDTTKGRKRLIPVSHDVKGAQTIVLRIEDAGAVTDEFTDPPAASTTSLLAATATTVAPQTILAAALTAVGGKNELALRPRNITFTVGGTAAQSPTSAVITGTDINGDALTETVAITASAGTYAGVKAFKTITSVVYGAAGGAAATISIGYGAIFGLSRKAKSRAGAVNRGTEIAAGAFVTTGTLVAAATSGPNGTYAPATAPNGANDYAITYEIDGGADLLATEFIELELVLYRGT